ncbi:helix-turn-helix domain-containing protein [Spongiactinospora sp. TRM90649]|uniref:helix-turn-helix domain-containing protein n=1 Tax=Spongiactinospora sp. TRM90649 TaxID=3031114 RepID=UPI0023F67A0D|nr:helix-turn-helix domain-containing protein [Spongiactinospora sp. TRM90649]MDF5758460.1 helix-turn-helix domain-containing protein [Spongiactinospora sp. TRM90649]
MSETWTIGELAERAADTLRAAPGDAARAGGGEETAGRGAVNGRIREVPGERLIRWYTTIGLIDPPLSRRGRVARYGRRHLLQLVAIKRLQAGGMSIADIQVHLAGATDSHLASLAGVTPAPDIAPTATADAAPRRARFWTSPGGSPPVEPAAQADPFLAGAPQSLPAVAFDGGVRAVQGVRLAPGVVLLLDGAERAPSAADVAAIAEAAGPLLAVLAERGLTVAAAPSARIAHQNGPKYQGITDFSNLPDHPDIDPPSEGSTA